MWEPWGTPKGTVNMDDLKPLNRTNYLLFNRSDSNILRGECLICTMANKYLLH